MTSDEVPGEAATPAGAPVSVPFRAAVVALLVAVLALRLWSVSRWSWMYDDWIYLEQARSMGFVDFLFQNYNSHVMPGEFLVAWLVATLAPLSHTTVVVLTALASTAATAVWAVALRELCGERVRTLVPLALIALTPLHLQGTIWWAAALQTVPLQATLAGCVYFAARLARHGRRADRVGLLLTLVGGLVMWEKALLVAIPVAAVIIYLSPRRPGRWRRIIREGLVISAVAVPYLVLYLVMISRESTGPFPVEFRWQPVGAVLRSFGELGGHLLAPGVLGGPWGTLPVEGDLQAHPAAWQVALTAVVVGAGLVAAAVLRRSAWVPLGMVLVFGTVSWGLLVQSGRLEVLGLTKLGYERYAADIFTVLCLALALWLTPEASRRPAAGVRLGRTRPAARARLLPVVAVVAVVASLAVANVVGVHRIGVSPTRAWLSNVQAEVDEKGPVTVVNGYAPDDVLYAPFFGRYAELSRMLEPLGDQLRFDGSAANLYTFTPEGRLEKAVIVPAVGSKPGPAPDCGWAIGAGETVEIAMTSDIYAGPWLVQVNAFTSTTGGLDVEVGGQTLSFDFAMGLNAPQAMFVGPVADELRVTSTADEGVICVTDLLIGAVADPAAD